MSLRNWIILTALAALIGAFGFTSLYVVAEYEFAIVTQFGKVVTTETEPGLKFKIPFIQKVTLIDKRLRDWDGEPSDLLTIDKENVEVNTWARWRVTNPQLYYEAVRTETRGLSILDGLVDASVKNVVSAQTLYEALRNTKRKLKYSAKELEDAEEAKTITISVGRDQMAREVLKQASTGAAEEYGFTISGLEIKHFNYVKPVIPKIYERMRSERIRIANRYESEGREREAKILGNMKKDLEEISSRGYAKAATIRGEADAAVLTIYADAYGQDADFYSFSRSLDLYPSTFSKKTRLILSTDEHDFLRYVKGYGRADGRKSQPRRKAVPVKRAAPAPAPAPAP
jgi:membrane protease subunit HflC